MEKAKRNGEYWRRAYECPFYLTNKIGHVECEAATIYFNTKPGIRSFLNTCETGYKDCPIYKSLMIDYDEKEKE